MQANYGTIRIGECIGEHLSSFTGCVTDALDYFDRKCSGLQSCTVSIPQPELNKELDCLMGISPYVEASYKCVAGNYKFCNILYFIYNHDNMYKIIEILSYIIKLIVKKFTICTFNNYELHYFKFVTQIVRLLCFFPKI